MIGILDQPYLSFDKLLDVQQLIGLEDEIFEGIVRSKRYMSEYGSGLVRTNEEKNLQDFSETFHRVAHDRPLFEELQKRFPDREDLKYYLALKNRSMTFFNVITLRELVAGTYDGISYSKFNADTENVRHFPRLMNFIRALPMRELGRVEIFVAPPNATGRMHTDALPHQRVRHDHEFIWMRPNLDKRFYVFDAKTKTKHLVKGHTVYFQSLDLHGYDPTPYHTVSIRIDGFFTDEFKRQVGLIGGQQSPSEKVS